MTEAQRKAALVELQTRDPEMTGIHIMYKGERKPFNAYLIPLNCLIYNPYNGRIGSSIKSFERQNHRIDPENADDVKIIEKFLYESKRVANDITQDSLLKEHQQQYGIVTADGMIIDGNRRACLLNRIMRDSSINSNEKQHCGFFLAIILPQDAEKKEILRLETTFQMGEDAKLDYNPIEKYLKCGDLIEANFTEQEIADFMRIERSQVSMYLRVLKLMDEYLDSYGYNGMYTQLAGEDSFQKLDSALRGYMSGGASGMWDYDIETDVSDLKSICFDYIRLGMEQTDFRDIIRKPTAATPASSFFACEDIWDDFSDKHFKIVESVTEKPVQELIEVNPAADISMVMKARDEEWRRNVKSKMLANYKSSKDVLQNKQDASAPVQLLSKALSALSSIDTSQDTFLHDPQVKTLLEKIGDKIDVYEGLIG